VLTVKQDFEGQRMVEKIARIALISATVSWMDTRALKTVIDFCAGSVIPARVCTTIDASNGWNVWYHDVGSGTGWFGFQYCIHFLTYFQGCYTSLAMVQSTSSCMADC
jgi:hypothetical protein